MAERVGCRPDDRPLAPVLPDAGHVAAVEVRPRGVHVPRARAAQLLTLVAGTPYARHLFEADSRVTYDFATANPQRFPEISVQATRDGGEEVAVSVEGRYSPPAGTGRSVATWTIEWSGGAGRVTGTDTRPIEIAASKCIALPGSSLTATTAQTPVDGVWRIAHKSMVEDAVAAVDSVLASDVAVSALFPPGCDEPLATYWALTTHAMFPYRAAGVALALAERTRAYGI